jgi:lipopolysaccharide/colanic/teichoic acid biosynthesis glycosyltransferase
MKTIVRDFWATAEPRPLLLRVPLRKRAFDIFCIGVALPVLVPLMLLIAAAIKILSRGPVFFKQERVGLQESRFRCLKFRSMKLGAVGQAHQSHTAQLIRSNLPLTKMDQRGDPRLIPLGWLFRSTGLDELPQLINVLRGEMSLVGPRPCTNYEYALLQPSHRERFDVLPGLTGLWQVSGKNKTTFEEMIRLDISYARNWSLLMDFKIMLKTLPVLFGQVGEMVGRRIRG